MSKRIVVGAVLIAFMAGVVLLDWHLERIGWPAGPAGAAVVALPLSGLLLVVIAAGYLEIARLAARAGVPVLRFSGMVSAMVIGTLPFWRQGLAAGTGDGSVTLPTLGIVVLVLFADQILSHGSEGAIRRLAGSLLAVCYLGVGGAILLAIRIRFGVGHLVLFLAAVKFMDIGAYFTGTALGRRKLAPALSPGKTWEGLAGGLAAAAGGSAGLAALVNLFSQSVETAIMTVPAAAAFGAVVGLFGQVGDLCESALKRDAGTKDAGRIIPGFGGVLDVVDSPLLAAPVGYVMLALLR